MMGDDDDVFGAAEAAAALEGRLMALRASPADPSANGHGALTAEEHVDGAASAEVSIMVYGSYGRRASRTLGRLVEELREAHPACVCVTWRHLPDPTSPRAAWLALAAEAAAAQNRFWSLHRELLALRHYELSDVNAAARRAGVDFDRVLSLMRAGTGADRITAHVAGALASGAPWAPALFINGRRFYGQLEADAVWATAHESVGVGS